MTATKTQDLTFNNVDEKREVVLRLDRWQVSMIREALAKMDARDAGWLRTYLESERDDNAWKERKELVASGALDG